MRVFEGHVARQTCPHGFTAIVWSRHACMKKTFCSHCSVGWIVLLALTVVCVVLAANALEDFQRDEPHANREMQNPAERDSNRKLIVATRIHSQKTATTNFSLDSLRQFIKSARGYADAIVIACDAVSHDGLLIAEVRKLAELQRESPQVRVIGVSEWGRFVPALNALLRDAAEQHASFILFQSVEFVADPFTAGLLLSQMSGDTLVSGLALPGHAFSPGSNVVLGGLTSPWNTMAVWSVPKLGKTGFLLISEGLDGLGEGGVEEVAVIAAHQKLWPETSRAKLVDAGSAGSSAWQTEFTDSVRQAWHAEKMASKDRRAAAQLAAVGLDGRVSHLRVHATPLPVA